MEEHVESASCKLLTKYSDKGRPLGAMTKNSRQWVLERGFGPIVGPSEREHPRG